MELSKEEMESFLLLSDLQSKTYFTKSFYFLKSNLKLVLKTGNQIIQTGNGIFWTPNVFGPLFYRNEQFLRTQILLGPTFNSDPNFF